MFAPPHKCDNRRRLSAVNAINFTLIGLVAVRIKDGMLKMELRRFVVAKSLWDSNCDVFSAIQYLVKNTHNYYQKVAKLAIKLTMYCHTRPPDSMPLWTEIFGTSRHHQRLNFDGYIYIRYAVPPYSVDTVFMVSVYGRWIKTPALFIVMWHSFVEWEASQNNSFYFSNFWDEPPNFDMHLQIWLTSQVVAKFG